MINQIEIEKPESSTVHHNLVPTDSPIRYSTTLQRTTPNHPTQHDPSIKAFWPPPLQLGEATTCIHVHLNSILPTQLWRPRLSGSSQSPDHSRNLNPGPDPQFSSQRVSPKPPRFSLVPAGKGGSLQWLKSSM